MKSDFSVTVLQNAEQDYYDLLEQARDENWEDSIFSSMSRAISLIRADARNVGEPLYDLKQMKMQVCRIICPPLYIEYGVHFSEKNVIIRRVKLIRKPA